MRLFIAIKFPKNVEQALIDTQNDLRAQGVHGNYSRTENLHITLAFLGEVKGDGAVKDIRKAMNSVKAGPMELELSEAGAFRELYWVGVKKNDWLNNYVGNLRQALGENGVWFDKKPFKPHITILREARGRGTIHVKSEAFTATKVSLMKSERINGKLTYTEIYSVVLK